MNYTSPGNWVKIKQPTYNKGTVVIESDDGMEGDFTHWMPLFLNKKQKYVQWFPSSDITFVPNVNTAIIGQTGRMTVDNLKTLNSYHFEIMSHGKHHAGVGKYKVTANVASGSTTIPIAGAGNVGFTGSFEPYSYFIADGTNINFFSIVSKTSSALTITPALSNDFAADVSFVELTSGSMTELLQGAIDDLASWGIDCKNHVYTYHSGSQHDYNQNAVDLMQTLFDSARGVSGSYNYPGDSLFKLKSQSINESLTTTMIDTILDETASTDAVTIFYGHGEKTKVVIDLLDYLIEGCMSREIKITTRKEAIKRLT